MRCEGLNHIFIWGGTPGLMPQDHICMCGAITWEGLVHQAALAEKDRQISLLIANMDKDSEEIAVLHGQIERLNAAIEAEPKYPGEMPDEMWELIKNDRDAVTKALRLTVELTMDGIRKRAEYGRKG